MYYYQDIKYLCQTTTSPPNIALTYSLITTIKPLSNQILTCVDKRFFISHCVPDSAVTEWSLVFCCLNESLSENPTALQDVIFLIEFLACHPIEKYFNAIKQCYWIKYHPIPKVSGPNPELTAHLIQTSLESSQYAQSEGLRSFC